MIVVTDEMIRALDPSIKAHRRTIRDEEMRAGLEAVMKLIDPVPADVQKLYIKKNDDEFWRVRPGGNVWRHECGCCYSTTREIFESADGMAGVVTW